MSTEEESLELHKRLRGKIRIESKVPIQDRRDLSLVYTPGVGAVSSAIAADPALAWQLTGRGNTVAVISDGSAVLGLGDIGPAAALPVMEGKCALFKEFAAIDAVPIVIGVRAVEDIVAVVKALAPSFGAINLEDISAPRCFEIEERLKQELDIPVMHDDQHGTAVVVLAGLLNAAAVAGRDLAGMSITVNGVGAAGTAIVRLIRSAAPSARIRAVDSRGIIAEARADLSPEKLRLIADGSIDGSEAGSLQDSLHGSDVFVGVSKGNLLSGEDIARMNPNPIIFALANPVPEIMPDKARAAGAMIVATGRSDFPNQINNVLAYPGIFRGVLDIRAGAITEEMKLAAARALAGVVRTPTSDRIIPDVFDPSVVEQVAAAVKESYRG